jgi:hypothetical protein
MDVGHVYKAFADKLDEHTAQKKQPGKNNAASKASPTSQPAAKPTENLTKIAQSANKSPMPAKKVVASPAAGPAKKSDAATKPVEIEPAKVAVAAMLTAKVAGATAPAGKPTAPANQKSAPITAPVAAKAPVKPEAKLAGPAKSDAVQPKPVEPAKPAEPVAVPSSVKAAPVAKKTLPGKK